eukprot:16436228-Heterocapsa_arctica.AAC.1
MDFKGRDMEYVADIISMASDDKMRNEKMDGKELVGFWADILENKPKIRKPLGQLGSVRVHRNRAMAMADGKEAPNNYSII